VYEVFDIIDQIHWILFTTEFRAGNHDVVLLFRMCWEKFVSMMLK